MRKQIDSESISKRPVPEDRPLRSAEGVAKRLPLFAEARSKLSLRRLALIQEADKGKQAIQFISRASSSKVVPSQSLLQIPRLLQRGIALLANAEPRPPRAEHSLRFELLDQNLHPPNHPIEGIASLSSRHLPNEKLLVPVLTGPAARDGGLEGAGRSHLVARPNHGPHEPDLSLAGGLLAPGSFGLEDDELPLGVAERSDGGRRALRDEFRGLEIQQLDVLDLLRSARRSSIGIPARSSLKASRRQGERIW